MGVKPITQDQWLELLKTPEGRLLYPHGSLVAIYSKKDSTAQADAYPNYKVVRRGRGVELKKW